MSRIEQERGLGHLLLLAAAVIIVAVIAAGGWYIATHRPAAATTPKTELSITTTAPKQGSGTMSASEVVADITKAVKEAYPGKYPNPNPSAQHITDDSLSNAPIWRVSGVDFYAEPSSTSSTAFLIYPPAPAGGNPVPLTDADWQAVSTFVDSRLAQDGFAKQADDSAIVSGQFGDPAYAGKQAVCRKSTNGHNSFAVTCADYTAYSSAVAALKPIAAAYFTTYPDYRGVSTMELLSLTASKTPGYQIAEVATGNARAHFYAHNGQWHYVYSSQVPLTCDFSKYPDAKIAFIGQDCVDENGANTVQ